MNVRVRSSSDSSPAASCCCCDGVRAGTTNRSQTYTQNWSPERRARCVRVEPSPQALGHDPAVGADLEVLSGHRPAAHAHIQQPVAIPDAVDASGTLGNLIVGPVLEAVTWPCLQLLHNKPSRLLPTSQPVPRAILAHPRARSRRRARARFGSHWPCPAMWPPSSGYCGRSAAWAAAAASRSVRSLSGCPAWPGTFTSCTVRRSSSAAIALWLACA